MMTIPDRVPGRPTILVVEDDDLLRAPLVDPEAAVEGAAAAADGDVGKPFAVDVLLRQVEHLVRRAAGASPLVASA
jgi:hypothetical protein